MQHGLHFTQLSDHARRRFAAWIGRTNSPLVKYAARRSEAGFCRLPVRRPQHEAQIHLTHGACAGAVTDTQEGGRGALIRSSRLVIRAGLNFIYRLRRLNLVPQPFTQELGGRRKRVFQLFYPAFIRFILLHGFGFSAHRDHSAQ